jgi:hypothetical protein
MSSTIRVIPAAPCIRFADIIRFRLLMIAAGYADGNDATSLRTDALFKLALERLPSARNLCSQSTISRLENLPEKRTLLRLARALVPWWPAVAAVQRPLRRLRIPADRCLRSGRSLRQRAPPSGEAAEWR